MKLSEYQLLGKTFIIAEIAQAHDGSLGILHSLIDAAANTGVDAVKFQIHIANAESSEDEPFRVNFSYVDSTRFDYWKRMEFTLSQWQEIKSHCDDLKIEFLATPFSNAAVDLLELLEVKRYKIGSGDVSNFLLIEKIAQTKKEIIISSGLSSLDDLDLTIKKIQDAGLPYSVLQCTSKYPTEAQDIGLAWLNQFQKRYNCPVGLSDHSGTIFASLGAVALGATVIEAHITFDQRMFGPDSKASLDIDNFSRMVEGIRFLEKARLNGYDKNNNSAQDNLRQMFGKSIAVSRDLKAGQYIRFEDLEGKKPLNCGIPAQDFEKVIGRKLLVDKKQYEFLHVGDFK